MAADFDDFDMQITPEEVYSGEYEPTLEEIAEINSDDFWRDMNNAEDMDGDHESALRDAGFGTDEDYGCYGGEDDFGF